MRTYNYQLKTESGSKLGNAYRRAARKVYRTLRHPRRRRKSRAHNWLAEKVFDRHLWKPDRERVARGLAAGFFFALIPIPVQMLSGVVFAVWKRLNIPMVVAGCWLTNPATLWIYLFPFRLGCWILGLFGIEVMATEMTNWEVARAFLSFEGVQALLLGCLLMGAALAVLGYGMVHAVWAVWGSVLESTAQERAKSSGGTR